MRTGGKAVFGAADLDANGSIWAIDGTLAGILLRNNVPANDAAVEDLAVDATLLRRTAPAAGTASPLVAARQR